MGTLSASCCRNSCSWPYAGPKIASGCPAVGATVGAGVTLGLCMATCDNFVLAASSFRLASNSETPLRCVNSLDWTKIRPNPTARTAHTFQRFPRLNENSRSCPGAKPRSLAQAVEHKKCRTIRCNIGMETANRTTQTKATIHLPGPEFDRMKAGMPKHVPTIQAEEMSPSTETWFCSALVRWEQISPTSGD